MLSTSGSVGLKNKLLNGKRQETSDKQTAMGSDCFGVQENRVKFPVERRLLSKMNAFCRSIRFRKKINTPPPNSSRPWVVTREASKSAKSNERHVVVFAWHCQKLESIPGLRKQLPV